MRIYDCETCEIGKFADDATIDFCRQCKAEEKMKTTLRELREESGKSRAEVAAALNVTVQALSNYENGYRRIDIEQVLTLAKLYDCNAEEVIRAQLVSNRQDQ